MSGKWIIQTNAPHTCDRPKLHVDDQRTFWTGSIWECLCGARWEIDQWRALEPVWRRVMK